MRARDHAHQVHREHALPERLVGLGEPGPLVVARVVHEDVHRTELLLGAVDRRAHRVGRAHVELEGRAVHLFGDAACTFQVHVCDRYAGALGGQPAAGGGADPGGASGDQCCSFSESHRAGSADYSQWIPWWCCREEAAERSSRAAWPTSASSSRSWRTPRMTWTSMACTCPPTRTS